MKVNEELYILELPMNFGGVERVLNVSLIADEDHGLTLVDTGLPGQIDLIDAALQAEGFSLADIKQIVLTHQDLDHVGSLNPAKEKTGATIYAHEVEIPYIDGRTPMVKGPTPERLAANPGFAAIWEGFKTTPVDVAVQDGETLENSSDAVIIFTPGHTPGHMSLYLPKTKTLIAGDAMVSDSGKLAGPMEQATPDMKTAMESLSKLVNFPVETIVCYHGGLVTEDAHAQLKTVADSA